MEYEPRTPLHSRDASASIDISFTSASPNSVRRPSSAHSPSSNAHSLVCVDSMGLASSKGDPASSALGNLADELAEAWSEGEDEEYDEEEGEEVDAEVSANGQATSASNSIHDNNGPTYRLRNGAERLVPPQPHIPTTKSHKRQSSDYDGSDYGAVSEPEEPGIQPSLQLKLDLVESLARRGTESIGSASDGAIGRVVGHLQDLGGQAGVEGGATRLITSHAALATHLLHQNRLLHTLTYPLLSPLTLPPDVETIEEILPLLLQLTEYMPRPVPDALSSLVSLHTLTSDLIQSLSYLSDTLHMSRQATTIATRRLRSAREMVTDMRREQEGSEEAQRWLKAGDWSRRLEGRDCAKVCGDVVGGFEEVCESWRQKLLAQVEETAVA